MQSLWWLCVLSFFIFIWNLQLNHWYLSQAALSVPFIPYSSPCMLKFLIALSHYSSVPSIDDPSVYCYISDVIMFLVLAKKTCNCSFSSFESIFPFLFNSACSILHHVNFLLVVHLTMFILKELLIKGVSYSYFLSFYLLPKTCRFLCCSLLPLQQRLNYPLLIPFDWVWLWISQFSIMRSWIHQKGLWFEFDL